RASRNCSCRGVNDLGPLLAQEDGADSFSIAPARRRRQDAGSPRRVPGAPRAWASGWLPVRGGEVGPAYRPPMDARLKRSKPYQRAKLLNNDCSQWVRRGRLSWRRPYRSAPQRRQFSTPLQLGVWQSWQWINHPTPSPRLAGLLLSRWAPWRPVTCSIAMVALPVNGFRRTFTLC